jgi:hypothetical protein
MVPADHLPTPRPGSNPFLARTARVPAPLPADGW